MYSSKIEKTGLDVHRKIKQMVTSYGAMITGVPAETLGQNQAEISLATVDRRGNIQENINKAVKSSELTQPTNSCGQASNEVCMLLLGMEGASKFEKTGYEILTNNGDNLKSALPDKNLLVRLEVDRYDAPTSYRKIEREHFNPLQAQRNQIYLLEDQLLYLNEYGTVIDLAKPAEECAQLFATITSKYYQYYSLDDGFMELGDPNNSNEENAICEINRTFQEQSQSQHMDFWVSTHSFTIFAPQTDAETARTLYPYQAYWGKHTLQKWFAGNKEETLSQLGMDAYIKKLALLGTTTAKQERSNTYAQLFAPSGQENIFCTGVNEKLTPLRVKFKVAEVNPVHALENLNSVQKFIDTEYPGETPQAQCMNYEKAARHAMSKHMEEQLLPPAAKQESSVISYTTIAQPHKGRNPHS